MFRWYRAFFPCIATARHYRDALRRRNRVARMRRNGAGWCVSWRFKRTDPRRRLLEGRPARYPVTRSVQ